MVEKRYSVQHTIVGLPDGDVAYGNIVEADRFGDEANIKRLVAAGSIREATAEEVKAWEEAMNPPTTQGDADERADIGGDTPTPSPDRQATRPIAEEVATFEPPAPEPPQRGPGRPRSER